MKKGEEILKVMKNDLYTANERIKELEKEVESLSIGKAKLYYVISILCSEHGVVDIPEVVEIVRSAVVSENAR